MRGDALEEVKVKTEDLFGMSLSLPKTNCLSINSTAEISHLGGLGCAFMNSSVKHSTFPFRMILAEY